MSDRIVLAWMSGVHDYYEMLTAHRRKGVEPSQQTVCGKTCPPFGPGTTPDIDPDHKEGTWTCTIEQAGLLTNMIDSYLRCEECWK